MDMNRIILLNNLLALATIAVLGPGTSVLVREAARQAFALVCRKRRALPHQALRCDATNIAVARGLCLNPQRYRQGSDACKA